MLAALAAGCIYAMVPAVPETLVRGRRDPGPAAERLTDLPLDRARTQALRLADADPVAALRLLYPALIAELLRRRGWRAVAGRTNWSVVRRVGSRTPQGSALTECTRPFESAVYGRRPASRDDVSAWTAVPGGAGMSLSRDAIILICLVIVLAVGTLALSSGSKSAGPPYQLSGHGPVLGLSGLVRGWWRPTSTSGAACGRRSGRRG